MKNFKTFINEASTASISKAIQKVVCKKLGKACDGIQSVKSTSRMETLKIVSTDRVKAYEKTIKILEDNFDYIVIDSYMGSVGSYDIIVSSKYKIRLLFKPTAGGMTETTLNSTITELVPAILFMSNKSFSDVDACMKYLLQGKYDKSIYVNGKDAKTGKEFINAMSESSKFQEKMENAFGILKYLKEENAKSKISQVYWGYRKKPAGIDKNHKGDIFLKYKTGEMLGVSLKAGTSKSEEPKLNTYVRLILSELGGLDKLQSTVYDTIHKDIGLPKNWSPTKHLDIIMQYRQDNSDDIIDAKYNEMLDICRSAIVDAFNKSKSGTLDFINTQILNNDDSVPLVVVKAIGTNYDILTEEDDLEAFIPKVKTVKAYIGKSKQQFHIQLLAGTETLTLNMSIRTNKSKPYNKLAQGYNLAVKFNSLA